MKKVKFKRKYVLLALVSLFIGYIGLRYYIKPDWFDSKHIYHKVYDYKVSDVKPQKRSFKISTLNLSMIKMLRNLLMVSGKSPQEQM